MKTVVAVTLIIMGALLVMTPPLSDYLHQHNVVTLMTVKNLTSVSLAGQMGDHYRFGCWATGTGMIVIAVLGSVFTRKPVGASE